MNNVEKGAFIKLFNKQGYVLNFSTVDFDAFTLESVGIALCQHYGLSKGKSLMHYINDCSDKDAIKLLGDLLQYYEQYYVGRPADNTENHKLYLKCKSIINKEHISGTVYTPSIKNVDSDYIKNISLRAMNDIDDGNFDSAITKSRTLLEEVFMHTIEKKDVCPMQNGDIGDLYKQVKDLYKMHVDREMDIRIKTLLSGLEKIISSISEMRNKDSDAHGAGSRRIKISGYHARLFVNAAMTMADFILSVSEQER